MQHASISVNEILDGISARHQDLADIIVAMEATERWTKWSEEMRNWAARPGSAIQLSNTSLQQRLIPYVPARLTAVAAVVSPALDELSRPNQRLEWLRRFGVIARMSHTSTVSDTKKAMGKSGSSQS